jgi:hypothetical protein
VEEIKSEKELVRKLEELFVAKKVSGLKKIFTHTNLATKKFRDIWSGWWETESPPRLEVDIILTFEESRDGVFIVGVEVEFFRDESKNFYDGLQQIFAYGLFGFDGLVLWHIFLEEMGDKIIDRYVKPVKEIVDGFRLPILYLATKVTKDFQFEFFAPWAHYSSAKYDASDVLSLLKRECEKNRNPLLYTEEIKKRRNTLKIILGIPV